MKDDLEGKTLKELQELHQQLTHEIDVMDQMRVCQIALTIDASACVTSVHDICIFH
jgi:pentose-5-phosphate-3-epimerase